MKTKSAMRLRRMKRGYNLKELAELLNVTSSFLSAVENGFEKIPKNRVMEFNEAYGSDKHD